MTPADPADTLDQRGQRCPAPIIALGRRASAAPGSVVTLLADDPAAEYDVPAWCRLRGATLLDHHRMVGQGGAEWSRYTVRMPEPNAPGTSSSESTSE